jgi:flagellar hook assembly protein FlgD
MFIKWLRKTLITSVISTLAFGSITTASAFTLTNIQVKIGDNPVDPNLQITNVKVDGVTTDKEYRQTIEFCTNEEAYITVGIYEVMSNGSGSTVQILQNNKLLTADCYKFSWNGKYADGKDANTNGKYYYAIQGTDKDDSNDTEIVKDWITYNPTNTTTNTTTTDNGEGLIKDLTIDEDLEIEFELNLDAKVDVKIYDEDDKLVVTLKDDKDLEKGDYEYEWDGKDKDEDNVEDGTYYVKVIAETTNGIKDIDKKEFELENGTSSSEDDDPDLKNVFVSKESFDPSEDEEVSITFTLGGEADVKVTIYSGNTSIGNIYDEDDLAKGTYSVTWDGDNTPDGTYSIVVVSKNGENEDEEKVTVKLESDADELIYKNEISPMVFTPGDDEKLEFEFKLEDDSDVEIVVYKKGNKVAEIFEGELDEGKNEIKWDGELANGEYIKDGVYDYKITADNDDGEDKEWGKFIVVDSNVTKDKGTNGAKCGGYTDLIEANPVCTAAKWTKEKGIFEGYDDGSFKPYQPINRVEVLKAVLEGLGYEVPQYAYGNQGFSDVVQDAWYVKYISAGKMYGIVKGYSDGKFKPDNQVTKAEALVMLLNAAKIKSSLMVPYCTTQVYVDAKAGTWYSDAVCYAKYHALMSDDGLYFYPDQLFTRGEMAQLIHTFYQAGLIK